jgi:hypothetical protein
MAMEAAMARDHIHVNDKQVRRFEIIWFLMSNQARLCSDQFAGRKGALFLSLVR